LNLKAYYLLPGVLIIVLLQSCAIPLIIAGAAAGGAIAYDKRSAGTILDDETIEFKIAAAIRKNQALAKNSHISVISYNGTVLLVGQAPTRALRDKAVSLARSVPKVKNVHDEIAITQVIPLKARNYDSWITTKVKNTLLGSKGIASLHVKVITENRVTYLMGIVTRDQGKQIARVVQQVDGVKRVVKVFEYHD